MPVSVVGHVFGTEQRGVVFHAHIVEELGETQVAVVFHGAAVHVDAVVDLDVDVLESVEAVHSLVIIGAVAIEMGAVVTDVDVADEAHGFGAGGLVELVGVFDMD